MRVIIVSKYVKASRKSTLDVFLATHYVTTNCKARFSLIEI